jgi:hypothetical protein
VDGGINYSQLLDQSGESKTLPHGGNKRARDYKFPQPKTKLREMTATQREKYNKKWDGLNEMELRHILRDDERARLLKEEEKSFAKVSDVKYMKPLSKKMQEWKKEQWKIYKKKKGIVAEDNDDGNP